MPNLWNTPLWQATQARILSAFDRNGAAPSGKNRQRMYAAARSSRLRTEFGSTNTSANAELTSSLTALRARARQLVRDSAYAKRAKKIIVDNVIGTGIGVQAEVRSSREGLRGQVNKSIYDAWWKWCAASSSHTGGQLHFCDFERQAMGQVFEAGECVIRMHFTAFGNSRIPLALEIIEAERIADDFAGVGQAAGGNKIVQGIEVDTFYRPQAYWLKTLHPGETRIGLYETTNVERVPADQIIHLRIIDRWPQVRGEPWLHAVIGKLADINGYTEAEIVAARAGAMYFGTLETDEDTASLAEEQDDGSYQLPLEPGMVEKLKPGEKLNFVAPNRPNAALDPFLRYMLREMAAGCGTSYESLSRDYSQSNYSSSRLALLEDRDTWRALQQWFIRTFRERLHAVWMQQATAAGAIQGLSFADFAGSPDKFGAVSFKPRGWSWVDPTKEVEAYSMAVKAGFTTVTSVIAESGGGKDMEEVLDERERELEEMEARDLVFDTSPEVYAAPKPAAPATAAPVESTAEDSTEDPPENTADRTPTRVVALRR